MRADYQPLLVVVEDLHWIDPSSLDLLTQLIEHVPQTRQLVVLSFRPEFTPPWPDGPGLERLNLNRLDRDASVRIVTEIAGMPAPAELLDQLVEKADGVPLYLEELTKLVSRAGPYSPWQRAARSGPPAAGTGHPGNARGLADSTSGPADRCQGCRAARGSHRPAILIRATRSRVEDDRERGHAGATAQLGPAGRRWTALRRTRRARRDLHLQTRPHPGRGLWVAAADNAAAVSPAHRAGADRALPGHGRDRA